MTLWIIINEEGILNDEDSLPMSVLDFTAVELKSIEEYLMAEAYKNVCQLGQ